jgi:hypothetical protein
LKGLSYWKTRTLIVGFYLAVRVRRVLG